MIRPVETVRWNDGVAVVKRETLTVIRSHALTQRLQCSQRTYLAAGSVRGGTSLLGYLLHHFGLIKGPTLHAITHEDLAFEQARGIEEWKSLIEIRNDQYDVWALKLPIIARQMNFFENTTRNPIFTMIFRNPLDLSLSIMNRDNRFERSLEGFIQSYFEGSQYYNEFFHHLRSSHSPMILISMENAQKNPTAFVREFMETLGCTPTSLSTSVEALAGSISIPGYKPVGRGDLS